MRGDNYLSSLDPTIMQGSPPHAWGQSELNALDAYQVRLTPTCVGTIRMWSAMRTRIEAHPHMRGDNLVWVCCSRLCKGSPPHAWGQFNGAIRKVGMIRLTPTCVGTIGITTATTRSLWAHPHMRGDNLIGREGRTTLLGSPPHAWGQ